MVDEKEEQKTYLSESNKPVRLRGNQLRILEVLRENPTMKYVTSKIHRPKSLIGRDINKLLDKGFIKKIGRGKYIIMPLLEKRIPIDVQTKFYLNKFCYFCDFNRILDPHHVFQRSIGGTDNDENLLMLCPNHHCLLHRKIFDLEWKNGFFYMISKEEIIKPNAINFAFPRELSKEDCIKFASKFNKDGSVRLSY